MKGKSICNCTRLDMGCLGEEPKARKEKETMVTGMGGFDCWLYVCLVLPCTSSAQSVLSAHETPFQTLLGSGGSLLCVHVCLECQYLELGTTAHVGHASVVPATEGTGHK